MSRFIRQKIGRVIAGITATLSLVVCLIALPARTQTTPNIGNKAPQVPVLAQTQAPTPNIKKNMDTSQMSARERLSQPSPNSRRLEPLIGTWDATLSFWESAEAKPTVNKGLVTTRRWVSGTHLMDETKGTLNGKPYYRAGFLGYNNVEQQYEFVTIDNVANGLMNYKSVHDDENGNIVVYGTFAEAGFGTEVTGEMRKMRSVFRTENKDRNVLELWLTPPAAKEFLEVEFVYTRQRK